MIDGDRQSLPDVETLVQRSVAARCVADAVPVLEAAAERSAALRSLRRGWQRLTALPLPERIGLLGVALLAFSVSNAALAMLTPEASAPAFPALICGPIAIAGMALVVARGTFAVAWTSRRRSSIAFSDRFDALRRPQKKNA